jgi:Ca-activated chloride channel family protein
MVVSVRASLPLLCAIVIAATAVLRTSGQAPSFRGGIDVVTLNVTATEGAHGYVSDLARDDFFVFEDGKLQRITYFRQTGVSLALALLIDTSASMDQNLPLAQEAAAGFVRELSATDVASIIDFNSRIQVRADFTRDHQALERAIRQTAAGGSTSLYNAVYIALQQLKKTMSSDPVGEPRRRAIVLLSDGEDTSSLMGFDEVLDAAARSDTAIYAIGLFGPARDQIPMRRASEEAAFVLRKFTEQTGGRAFFPGDAKELQAIYSEIRAELSNQYSLAYESSNPNRDGRFRRIAVRVQRPGVIARTRPGYYAPAR